MIRKLFYLTLTLVFLEGIVRKWIYSSSAVYLLKYIPVFFILILLVKNRKKIRFLKRDYPYYKILFLFIAFIALTIVSSYFGPIVWVVGMMAYVGFIPFMFVVPYIFKSFAEVEKFIKLLIVSSVPILILGGIQFFLPQSHILNHYAREMDTIATAGIYVRITSIFNYITGYTTYLTFIVPLIFSQIIYAKGKYKTALILLFVLSLFNLFATGSRGPVALALLALGLILFWILFKAKSGTKIKFILLSSISITVMTGLLYYNIVEFTSFDSLMTRTNQIHKGEISGRLLDLFTTPFKYAEVAGWGGFGIGSAHQIANAFGYDLNNYFHVPYEEALERFVLEMGIFGTVLYLVLLFTIFFDLTKKVSHIKRKSLQLLAFTIYTTLIQYFVFLNNIPYNWMGALHFYLGVGLIIALAKIDRNERNEALRKHP